MRYFLLGIVVLFMAQCATGQTNESVSSISFNPSRTGAYSYLKIVHKAALTGLDATKIEKVPVDILQTLKIENVCSGGDCPSPDIQINEVTIGLSNYQTLLETESGSLVRGLSTGASTEPESLGSVEDITTASEANYFNIGTAVEMDKGSILTSEGNMFISELVAGGPVVLNVKPAAEGSSSPTIYLRSGTINVEDSIQLGQGKIENSLVGEKTFQWCPKESSQVLCAK